MSFSSMDEWSIEDSIMFDQLCSNDTTIETSSSLVPLSKRQLTMRKYRAKRRANQQDLKRLVALLQDKLQQLQERHDMYHIINPPSSVWYELAVQEKISCKRAQDENVRLKEMVRQQMTITKAMASLMTKATDFGPTLVENQWQNRILVKDSNLRMVGIHQILDYEYSRLNSAFVEAGLIDASEQSHRLGTKYNPTTGFELLKIVCHPKDITMNLAIDSSWKMLHGVIKIDKVGKAISYIADIDENTSYITSVIDFPIGQIQRRLLCKRYYPTNNPKEKCVIVTRSIEQDEDKPIDPELPLLNEVSWSVFEAIPDGMMFRQFAKQSLQAQSSLSQQWSVVLEEYVRTLQDASHAYMHSQCPQSKVLAPEVIPVEAL